MIDDHIPVTERDPSNGPNLEPEFKLLLGFFSQQRTLLLPLTGGRAGDHILSARPGRDKTNLRNFATRLLRSATNSSTWRLFKFERTPRTDRSR